MSNHYTLSTEISFGKHQGWTVEDVLSIEPSYIDWMMREMKDTWDDEVSIQLSRAMDRQ